MYIFIYIYGNLWVNWYMMFLFLLSMWLDACEIVLRHDIGMRLCEGPD